MTDRMSSAMPGHGVASNADNADSDAAVVRKARPMVLTMMVGSFVAILNQTLMISAIPTLMREFALPSSTVQWLTTAFMLTNGIMIPITAFLIQRFSTRNLFLYAMGMFALGSLACMVAPNFMLLLAGRVIQACGAGILMPLLQTVLFSVYPPQRRGAAMGMFGMVVAFAPALGPTLSGLIIDFLPWRCLFALLLVIAAIVLAVAWFTVRTVPTHGKAHIDAWSVALSTCGFGGMLFGFSEAGNTGTFASAMVVVPLVVGVATLAAFIVRQLRLDSPMLDFRMFADPQFSLCLALGVIAFACFFGIENLVPLYLQNDLGVSALLSGLLMMPGGIMMGLLNPVAGRLFDRFGGRPLAFVGFVLIAVGSFGLGCVRLDTPAWVAMVLFVLVTSGSAVCSMPLTTAALNRLHGPQIPHGTAMNNTLRQMTGAMCTALTITIMNMVASASAGASASASDHTAMVHGMNVAAWCVAAVCVLCLLAACRVRGVVRRGR